MELPKDLKDEIWDFCRLNNIPNIDDFIIKLIKQGFTAEKYGSTPFKPKEVIKEVEKIVEKEVIKEVPVEIIKEIEKIVEKEVYITDDKGNLELTNKITKLESDIVILKNEISAQTKAVFKTSKERNEYRDKVKALNEEIEDLKKELEAEKAKPKEEKKGDIYGESKRGFFGSNTSDIYGKE